MAGEISKDATISKPLAWNMTRDCALSVIGRLYKISDFIDRIYNAGTIIDKIYNPFGLNKLSSKSNIIDFIYNAGLLKPWWSTSLLDESEM